MIKFWLATPVSHTNEVLSSIYVVCDVVEKARYRRSLPYDQMIMLRASFDKVSELTAHIARSHSDCAENIRLGVADPIKTFVVVSVISAICLKTLRKNQVVHGEDTRWKRVLKAPPSTHCGCAMLRPLFQSFTLPSHTHTALPLLQSIQNAKEQQDEGLMFVCRAHVRTTFSSPLPRDCPLWQFFEHRNRSRMFGSRCGHRDCSS